MDADKGAKGGAVLSETGQREDPGVEIAAVGAGANESRRVWTTL